VMLSGMMISISSPASVGPVVRQRRALLRVPICLGVSFITVPFCSVDGGAERGPAHAGTAAEMDSRPAMLRC
jgi:hypothetical protein